MARLAGLLIAMTALTVGPLQCSQSSAQGLGTTSFSSLTDGGLAGDEVRESPSEWIDKCYEGMTADQKIGQLLMVRAHSDRGPEHEQMVRGWIEKYHVGGLCFFQGTARRQAELTADYQSLTRSVPLMIAMDAEWGLGMRLQGSAMSFPRALTLAAMPSDDLVYDLGLEIGRQCRRMGIHINFAPVLDVNNNPLNPVINDRSFGENLENVISKASAYVSGLQQAGVLACGKHFPGHGDTDVDSHFDLPLLLHDRRRLEELEMAPFRALFERGIASVMVGHLSVPALDKTDHLPTSLSIKVVDEIIRRQLQFDGLVFTDALEMKGVTKFFPPGVAEVKAFLAGNDILLLPEDVGTAVQALRTALQDGVITNERLEQSVKRILSAKYRLGLDKRPAIQLQNLEQDLNTVEAQRLRRRLYEHSLVLVRDNQSLLPIVESQSEAIATLAIGSEQITEFQNRCSDFAALKHFNLPTGASDQTWDQTIRSLEDSKLVIVSFHGLTRSPAQNFGLSALDLKRLKNFVESKRMIIVHFGNPYALSNYDNFSTVIQGFEADAQAQQVAAEAIFGQRRLVGKLPITVSPQSQ